MHPKRFFDPELQQQYFHSLSSRGLSAASIKRKQSCFSTFKKFAQKKRFYSPEAPITYPTLANAATLPAPAPPSPASKPPFDFRRFFNIYSLGALFLLILSGLSWGIYSQFISQARQNLAFSTVTNPIRPGRILSFQGRLTDSSGNPIISSTPIVFKLWNSESVGTGTSLYVSSTGNSQTVTPDDNGIFSVVIGKSHGLEISPSVFTENAEVWLEITAGGETMSPRQQIATVAYALNSETLQGLTIGTSGIGYKNTVAVFDDQGNLNLGETSPTIKSISGTLGIEGQAMLIKASDGSGGNITLNPDAAGIIRLVTEGTGSTAVGGFIEATNANLSSGNLYSGIINNDNRGYNFLEFKNFQAGTTISETRFSIGASGNLYLSGNAEIGATLNSSNISIGNTLLLASASQINYLTGIGSTIGSLIYHTGSNLSNLPQGTSGHLLQSNGVGATPTWVLSSAVGQTYSVLNGLSTLASNVFGLGGTLTQNTSIGTSSFSLNFLGLGGTQSLFIGPSGYVGIGNTNPGAKLDISGDLKVNGIFKSNGSNYIRNWNFEDGNDNWSIHIGNPAFTTVTDSATGKGVVRSDGSDVWIHSKELVPVDVERTYSVGGWFRRISGSATNTIYLAVKLTDANGSNISGDGTWWYYAASNVNVGTSWTFYTGSFGKNTAKPLPASAKYMQVGAILSYGSGDYAHEAQGLRIEDGTFLGNISTNYDLYARNGNFSGMVGIGITNPQYRLEILGKASDTLPFTQLKIGYSGINEGLFMGQVDTLYSFIGNNYYVTSGNYIPKDTSASSLRFTDGVIGFYSDTGLTVDNYFQPTARMIISSTGVGITGNLTVGGTTTLTGTPLGTGTTILYINNSGVITKGTLPAAITYTASNGVTLSGSDFRLGGLVNQVTSIGISNASYLNFIGLGGTQALFIGATGYVGIGTTSPTSKLHIIGDATITANTSIGGTLDLDGTALGTGTTALMIASNGTVSRRALGSMAFDSGTYDNYQRWMLQTNGANTTAIGSGTTVNFVNGTGISLAQSGSTITINNTSLGTTYAAGVGLSLSATNIFSVDYDSTLDLAGNKIGLNLGSTNVWLAAQYFTGGIGVTGNSTFTNSVGIGGSLGITGNLTVGNSFVSVGSSNIVTNLNADLLDGYNSTYFVNVGQTGSFLTTLSGGSGISISGTGTGRTIAASLTNGLGFFTGSIGVSSPTCSGTDKLSWNGTAFVCSADVGSTYSAGIGISISSTNVISNIGVTSILGTANQVNVSGSTGAVTLSLPQNIHTGANPTFAKLGLGSTSASYTLNVIGNGYFSTALTVGTSLSVTGNVGIGGTLDLDGTALGTGTTALMIASNGTVSKRALSPLAFDFGTYDNYNHWKLQANGTGTTNILTSNTVNFVNGTGISLAQSGSTITINNTSLGTTYAAGVGLSLTATNIFNVNLGTGLTTNATNQLVNAGVLSLTGTSNQIIVSGAGGTGALTLSLPQGIGTTSNVTFRNLTIGGTFVSVGSTNTTTNLSADYLDGRDSTYFVNVGQTGNFLQVGYTGFFNTALNGLQKIGSTGVGLGGTLSQNTNINLSSYSLSYLGLGNTQSLYLSSSGNVGIGNTSAAYKLHLTDSSTTYTAYFYNSSTSPSAAGLYLRTDGSGDILTLNAGGTDVVNITAAAANFNLPTSFNSSGDLSVAYNLLFTNPASSSITAQAPLTIQTDSPSDNLDLTLQAANTGQVIINDSAQIADNLIIGGTLSLTGTNVGTGSTILYIDSSGIVTKGTLPSTSSHTASNGITLSSFDFRLGGLINQATSIGISNASYLNFTGLGGTQALFIGTTGYVGIGTTNPQYKLHVVGNIGTTGNATIGGTLTVTNSIIGARFTDSTSFPKYFIQPSNSDSTKASLSLYRDGSIRFNFNEDDGTHIATGNAARIQGYSNGLLLSSSTSTTGTISGWDSQLFLENGTGNVGIGTTNPGSKLEVFGEVSISNSSGNGLLIANSGANVELQFMGENASNIYSESSDLYFRLDSNNTAGNGTYRFLNGGSTEILTLYQDAGYSRLNTNTAGFWIDENLGLSNELLLFNANSGGGIKFKTGGSLQIVDTGVNPYVHFDATSKYVGIGTTNPTSALTVQGTDWNGITLNSTGTALLRATPSGGGAFVIDNASSSGTYLMQGGSTKNIFTSSGWLGIGITSNAPTGLLHVGTTFSTPALFVSSSNLVGIGTTSPLASLHIGSTATSGLHESLRLNFRRQTGGYGSKISFADPTDNTEWGRIAFGSHAFGGMNNGFTFGVYGTIGYKDEMHLNENGLGIGTTAPGYRLDVNGNARIGTTLIVPQISSANSTNLFIGAGLNGKTILAAGGTGVGSTGSGSIYFYKSDGTTSAGRLDTTAAQGTGTTVFHVGFTGNGVGSSTSFNMSSNTFRVGQVLTMPDSIGGNLSAVTLKIGCSNSASNNNNISMKFFPNVDVGGTPTGSPVLSVGKSISSLNSYPTFNEVTFTFSNGTLTAGALQAFDIGGTYNANPCYLNYFTSTGADPSNSQYAIKSDNAGVGWTKYTPSGTTYAELWYKLWRTSNYGLLYVSGVVTDSADVAENYSSDDSLKPGDLVSANPNKYGYIQKADPSRPDLLYGVISTSPGVLMGKPDIPEASKYPVALNGRVPTNFSLENGPVDPGDPITLSSILPGVGMKAISAGYIIGKAITGSQNCLPGEICSIEVLIQPNWYDPDAFLQATDSGLITYSGNIDPENIVSLGYLSAAADLSLTSNYSLTSSLGHTIKRLGQYAHLSTAELQAGLVKSKNIISDITLSKTSISEKVVTSLISPRSSVGIGTTLTIDSDTSITGSLFARDVAATWATIDHLMAQTLQVSDLQVTSVTANSASIKDLTATDATISGLALLNQISAKEATISALYADSIISKEGSFTDLMTQKISTLRQEIQNTLTSMSGTTTPVPDLNYTLLSQSTSWLAEISSDSATISGNLSLTDNLVIGGQLAVAGQTQLASALITGDLQVGQIQLNSNQIEAVASSLYLQPSATGSVHIMGDTLVIAENGQVHINGNLSLTGKLIAQEASVSGSLTALLINASEASIAGTLKANTVETENLRIAASPAVTIASPSESTASATQTAVASNTIAGTAILPAGSTQLVVYNQKLTPSSMVYLTPVGSTNNQVLYLKDKTISPTPTESPDSQSRFTIALDQPLNHPVEVNWWIIN